MNLYQSVMIPRCRFKRWIDRMLRPIARIIEQRPQLHGNLLGIDANIFLRQPVTTCPGPDIAKELHVESTDKNVIEDVDTMLSRDPDEPLLDIRLLQFVQLTACADVFVSEALPLIGVERCRAFRFHGDHSFSQKPEGISRTSSSVIFDSLFGLLIGK